MKPTSLRLLSLLVFASLLAGSADAAFTVSGTARYVDREWSYNGFTGVEPELPVRYADVEIVQQGGSVLAEGYTDANGGFAVTVPGNGPYNLYVRIVADTLNARGSESRIGRVRVVDFATDATYTVASPVFNGVSSNLNVGTVVAPPVTEVNGRLGNPFNMLDLVVDCLLYLTSPMIGDTRYGSGTTVRVRWPSTGSGSYASGSSTVIGYEAGYDDCIILHELGHVFHNIYSDSDNPGGGHSFSGTDQDPRLSFGEGWATYFEMAVLQFTGASDPGVYVNTSGEPGAGNLDWHARAEDGSPYSVGGAASEWAIVCALWDMADNEFTPDPFPPVTDDDPFDSSLDMGASNPERGAWEVLVGPIASASNLTHMDFWDGWFNPVDRGVYEEIRDVHNTWGIWFQNDDDEFNGNAANATPISPNGQWSGRKTIYYSPNDPPAPGVGDRDYYSFFVGVGSEFEIETRYDGGDASSLVDPYLELIAPNGVTVLDSDDDSGSGRNARIEFTALETGTHYARVREADSYRDYGHYNLRVRITNVATPPIVDSVTPDRGPIGGGALVTITGGNFVGDVSVTFDGIPSISVQVTDINSLTCTVPTGVRLGGADIVVENSNGASDPLVGGYEYYATLGLVGTPSPGAPVTLGAFGTPNADWGLVSDRVLGPRVKKGIEFMIRFSRDFEIVANSFAGLGNTTSPSGQSNAPYTIPDEPGLIGQPLYFETVYDNNGPDPGKELVYGTFLEVVVVP